MNTRKVSFFYNIIQKMFGTVMVFTFISMLFFKEVMNCPPMNRTKGNDIIYFLVSFVVSFPVFGLIKKLWKRKQYDKKKVYCIMLIASAIMYAAQILILRCIWFETGWDVTCVYYDAVHRAEDGVLLGCHEYFIVSPNNVMLTFLFAIICKVLHMLGIQQYYLVLCCIGAFLINVAGYLVFQVVFKLLESVKASVIAWLVYMLFIGLSPWMCVPYTDVYAIIFPIGIFYLSLCKSGKRIFNVCKWVLIGFLGVFGYFIKPTAFIMTIAVFIIYFFKFFMQAEKKCIVIAMLLMVAGGMLGVLFNVYARNYMGFISDEDKELPIAHYLMLGQNDKTYGVFDGADRALTVSFATKEEKVANAVKVANERFVKRGFTGNLRFFIVKNILNYNNGTFSWAYEGEFFKDVPVREDGLSIFLRDVYYPDGKYHNLYAIFCQGVWLLILFGCIGLFIEKQGEKYVVAMLAVLGLTLFLLIFESRARYLFLYTPIYLVLGMSGLKKIYDKLNKLKRKVNE